MHNSYKFVVFCKYLPVFAFILFSSSSAQQRKRKQQEDGKPIMDKRNTRTLNSIYKALLQLMSEKAFNAITVKELCSRADVNKSTFYNYFNDIFDCREKWMIYNVESVFKIGKDNFKEQNYWELIGEPRPYLEHILDYIEENLFYFKKLYNSPYYGVYISEFKQLLIYYLTKSNHISIYENCQDYLRLVFLCGGIVDSIFSMINKYDRDMLCGTLEELMKASHNQQK